MSEKYISNIEQATQNITLANLEAIANGLRCAAYRLLLPREEEKTEEL